MTTSTSLHANSAEYYDPDADALPRNSPPMTSFKPGLDPDIDPEYESLDKPGSNPSKHSDIVLFDLLNCDRVKNRAQDPVNASDRSDLASADDEPSSPSCASPSSALSRSPAVAIMAGSESLQILAMGALAQSAKHQTNGDHQIPPILETSRHANSHDARGRKSDHGFLPTRLAGRSSIHDIAPIQASQSIASPPRKIYSPIQTGTSPRDGSRDLASPVSPLLPASGLPPLQNIDSPRSDSSSQGPLPSIRQHFGNLALSPDNDGPSIRPPTLPHSPPASFPGISSMSTLAANRTSPPISPSETYARRELPSPSQTLATPSYYYSQRNGIHRMGMEHQITIESGNGDHHPLASPGSMLVDRMSIDGLTNPAHQPPPPPGGFVCTFTGCNAMPFQTQYLLNSHANVHSSARPHYCHVQGCPRSEGGKGFKRKNEMIRHGLVHESPGYVCPFCPDREHKYPRPDNLQRHVRVHHLDKDKDDPLLRDVLSQRPDGPNRGRRRRGNPA